MFKQFNAYMFKTYFIFMLLAFCSCSFSQTTINVPIKVSIFKPIVVTENHVLSFGSIAIKDGAKGKVIVKNDGTYSAPDGFVFVEPPHQGEFSISTTPPDDKVHIGLSISLAKKTGVMSNLSNANQTIAVKGINTNINQCLLKPDGTCSFNTGAEISVNNKTPLGQYEGSYVVNVDYV